MGICAVWVRNQTKAMNPDIERISETHFPWKKDYDANKSCEFAGSGISQDFNSWPSLRLVDGRSLTSNFMNVTIKRPTTVNVTRIGLKLAVNYEEEEIPNDFPMRQGDLWSVSIDMDSGRISNWPQGKEAKIHLTVKDCGSYYLYDSEGELVAKMENDYVPHGVVPGKYGDTVELTIASDGTITNWSKHPDLSEFFRDND